MGQAIYGLLPDEVWGLNSAKSYDPPKRGQPDDKPSACITCGDSLVHPSGERQFTVREVAALTGFPDTFKLPSRRKANQRADETNMTKTSVLTQLGNAVPPLVMKKVVGNIIKTLKEFDDGEIDKTGMPIKTQQPLGDVKVTTNSMRQLSLEPTYARLDETTISARTSRFVTLSPDPPARMDRTRNPAPNPLNG